MPNHEHDDGCTCHLAEPFMDLVKYVNKIIKINELNHTEIFRILSSTVSHYLVECENQTNREDFLPMFISQVTEEYGFRLDHVGDDESVE